MGSRVSNLNEYIGDLAAIEKRDRPITKKPLIE
jgi:hypothetical protein